MVLIINAEEHFDIIADVQTSINLCGGRNNEMAPSFKLKCLNSMTRSVSATVLSLEIRLFQREPSLFGSRIRVFSGRKFEPGARSAINRAARPVLTTGSQPQKSHADGMSYVR
ncbi:MAG: hypothetical protein AAFQ58_19820 [Pseudomonadota bacterium]